jgi:2-haloacid dehalogenase
VTKPIKAVVFDAYGTLFDVYSIGALAETLFPGQGSAVSVLWRDKQLEYSRIISLSDPDQTQGSRYYLSFWEITRRALRYTLERLRLPFSDPEEQALMGQYAKLSAFPEVRGVLQAIRDQGLPCAILSNGSPEMLASAVDSAGIEDLMDGLISVDAVRQFKTLPVTYQRVLDTYPVSPEEILFVSSNAWDVVAATWFGFSTVWVNRLGLPYETIGEPPTYEGNDLERVLAILKVSGVCAAPKV